MTFYIFHNEPRSDYENFCYFEEAFTKEECEKILGIGDGLEAVQSAVGGGDVSEPIRKSRNSWIGFDESTAWLFDKLGEIVRGANNVRYKFQLTGFMEKLQYTIYDDAGSHYKLHTDFGRGHMAQRKLSMVLMLTDPESYEGGELEFFDKGGHKFKQGTVVVFPSFEVHGVRPVTKGVRKSIVAWVSGEPFR